MGSRSVPALALVAVALASAAAGCGGGGSSPNANAAAGTTTGAGRTQASFQACLKAHGVTLPAGGGANGAPPAGSPPAGGQTGGTPPAGAPNGNGIPGISAKQRKAFQACGAGAGFARGGRGGSATPNSGAVAKYTACLKSHGVTFGSTNSASSTFKNAQKACNSLLPTQTTTTTP